MLVEWWQWIEMEGSEHGQAFGEEGCRLVQQLLGSYRSDGRMSAAVVLGFGFGFVVEVMMAVVLSLEGVDVVDAKLVLEHFAFDDVGRGILKNDDV